MVARKKQVRERESWQDEGIIELKSFSGQMDEEWRGSGRVRWDRLGVTYFFGTVSRLCFVETLLLK